MCLGFDFYRGWGNKYGFRRPPFLYVLFASGVSSSVLANCSASGDARIVNCKSGILVRHPHGGLIRACQGFGHQVGIIARCIASAGFFLFFSVTQDLFIGCVPRGIALTRHTCVFSIANCGESDNMTIDARFFGSLS